MKHALKVRLRLPLWVHSVDALL